MKKNDYPMKINVLCVKIADFQSRVMKLSLTLNSLTLSHASCPYGVPSSWLVAPAAAALAVLWPGFVAGPAFEAGPALAAGPPSVAGQAEPEAAAALETVEAAPEIAAGAA